MFLVAAFFFILNALAADSKPPYGSIPDRNTIQQATPCRLDLDGNLEYTAAAYLPNYNSSGEIISHGSTTSKLIDSSFIDHTYNGDPLPSGLISHDTIVKASCKTGGIEQPDGVATVVYQAQGYFYARCSNGYMKTCHIGTQYQDSNMAQYYTKYSGTTTNTQCLKARRDEMLTCRQPCDVTRLHLDSKYRLSITPSQGQDFIGFDGDGNQIFVTYYYVPPSDNIAVNCGPGYFLSHSTPSQIFTQFSVRCNNQGYIEYPNEAKEDFTLSTPISYTCVNTYACKVPSDSWQKDWGIFQNGLWKDVNKIPDSSFVWIKCGNYNNERRSASCMNGNLVPNENYVCQ